MADRPARDLTLAKNLALATVSGVLYALSFHRPALAPLAWVALVPWMLGLVAGPCLKVALLSSSALSVVLHAAACTWMLVVMRVHGHMPWPVCLVAYAVGAVTVLPYAMPAALAAAWWGRTRGCSALLALVPAWTLVDAARARMVLGFPWYVPGMSQAAWPTVIGVADLGGVHAVSALVLLGNVAVASLVVAVRSSGGARRRAVATLAVAGSLVVAGLAYGAVRRAQFAQDDPRTLALVLPGTADPTETASNVVARHSAGDDWRPPGAIRVGLVQGAVPQEVVMDSRPEDDRLRADLQVRLTSLLLERGAELVVWSESGYPATFADTRTLRRLEGLLADGRLSDRRPEIVLGGLADVWPDDPAQERTVTNSALLIDQRGPKGRYDKRYLVPFGEYVPARWFFFWFDRLTRTIGDIQAGTSDEPLASSHGRLGAFVCYEVVIPQHVREISRRDADLLVNVTNDGWYHGSAMPEQHLTFASMRAVESRKWLVRCANSGISAIVAPDGTIVGRLEEGERGVLLGSVVPLRSSTAYLAWGDWPLALFGLVTCFALAASLLARPGRRSDSLSVDQE